jgi:hypothetical protein
MSEEPVIAYPGNAALRKEVGEGFRITSHITDKRIAAVEKSLEESSHAFFEEANPDLDVLEGLVDLKNESPLDREKITTSIYNIRSFAKVLGLPLVTEICVHLTSVNESTHITEKKRKLLLSKLTEALRIAFTRRIRDDGGEFGNAMLENLRSYL